MRILLLFIGLSCFGLNAQKINTDSLWNIWSNLSFEEEDRLDALHKMASDGFLYSNPDSAYTLATIEVKFADSIGAKKEKCNALITKGVATKYLGNYQEAIQIHELGFDESKDIGDELGMANHLRLKGNVYLILPEFNKALDTYGQALELYEKQNDSKGVAGTLINMGIVFSNTGKYQKALDKLSRGISICDSNGIDSYAANALGTIGTVYEHLHNYKMAIENYRLAVIKYNEIGNLIGKTVMLQNLGSAHYHLFSDDTAMVYYEEAKTLARKIGYRRGEAMASANLGILYKTIDSSKALEEYRNALKIGSKINSNETISLAYEGMACLYHFYKMYPLAIEMAEKSLSVSRKASIPLGIIFSTQFLCQTHFILNDDSLAVKYLYELQQASNKAISINMPLLTEEEKGMYYKSYNHTRNLINELSLTLGNEYNNLPTLAYNVAVKSKGYLLRSSTALSNIILNSSNEEMIELYENWLDLKKEIAKQFSKGNKVEDLEMRANKLEKELVRTSKEFAGDVGFMAMDLSKIQAALKEDEIAVEFVTYPVKENYWVQSGPSSKMYCALIIDKNSDHPKMVRLFDEQELEKILGTFPGNNLSYIEQVYGTKENTKSQLYDLIWKPMEEELKGAKKVYISPIGLLHKISFAALTKEQDVYLCDLYNIEMKSSTGKIPMDTEPTDIAENVTTTLFGGIDYNSDSTATEVWNYLDGSLSEIQQIEKILKKGKQDYNYFNQANATETQFKDIASKSNILHIATHGFFYPDPDLAKEDFVDQEETKEAITFRGGRKGIGVNSFVKSRDPLMRSGLAFAGANDVWSRTNIEGEDGVLTAAEVATIDMRNTDLVVLSACETGLGDIKGSEGVYGLQRSFKMAGVKYIIMSLWQVPDKETAEFMTTFYTYLTNTKDVRKSFNQTQKDMRKKYDPYYWAAFVLVE